MNKSGTQSGILKWDGGDGVHSGITPLPLTDPASVTFDVQVPAEWLPGTHQINIFAGNIQTCGARGYSKVPIDVVDR